MTAKAKKYKAVEIENFSVQKYIKKYAAPTKRISIGDKFKESKSLYKNVEGSKVEFLKSTTKFFAKT